MRGGGPGVGSGSGPSLASRLQVGGSQNRTVRVRFPCWGESPGTRALSPQKHPGEALWRGWGVTRLSQ